MTARVLVVDDILPNVRLLEAKLSSEYFDVITAMGGKEAIEKAQTQSPDIILLDVMMPDMNGFDVCKNLKNNPATSHIPVVMVTALTDSVDKVKGLEVGADDFLSKPVDDVSLMARVRSLVRLKMTIDEWLVRENTANHLGFSKENPVAFAEQTEDAKILVVEDRSFEAEKIKDVLMQDKAEVIAVDNGNDALSAAESQGFDLIVVSLNLSEEDGLRLCSLFRSHENTRSIPVLTVCEDIDIKRVARALEIGAHDYIMRPLDNNELLARVRTQVRRKRYQDRLRNNYEESLSLALTDALTGLYNRRYLMAHLEKLIEKNMATKKSLCVMMLDIDHFKNINDQNGHDVGDDVLQVFANRVKRNLRSVDMVARYGGEEFCVVLPDVSLETAMQVAERVRKDICAETFKVGKDGEKELAVTVSIGAVLIEKEFMLPKDALKKADDELYKSKENGRNRVYFADKGCITL